MVALVPVPRWALVALAVVVATLGGGLLWLWIEAPTDLAPTVDDNRATINELACQIQRLGGAPVVAGVVCPTPSPGRTPTAVPGSPGAAGRSGSSSPARTVVVPAPGSTIVFSPGPGSSPSRPPSSSPSASPSATRTPVVRICLPPLLC